MYLESPPKEQRTLVDAESGRLSKNEWPFLHPGILSQPTTDIEGVEQRFSVSKGIMSATSTNSSFTNNSLQVDDFHAITTESATSCRVEGTLRTKSFPHGSRLKIQDDTARFLLEVSSPMSDQLIDDKNQLKLKTKRSFRNNLQKEGAKIKPGFVSKIQSSLAKYLGLKSHKHIGT